MEATSSAGGCSSGSSDAVLQIIEVDTLPVPVNPCRDNAKTVKSSVRGRLNQGACSRDTSSRRVTFDWLALTFKQVDGRTAPMRPTPQWL